MPAAPAPRLALLALLLGSLGAAIAAEVNAGGCAAISWQPAAGAEHSRWQEHDRQGQRLLRERGTLATLGLAASGHCAGWAWQLGAGIAEGTRAYDGRSSLGAAIQTSSRLRRLHWQAQALHPLHGAGHAGDRRVDSAPVDGWQAGVRLQQRRLWRDLYSVGRVQGYAERFDQWQLAAGLAGVLARGNAGAGRVGTALALDAALWLGAGPAGRLRLQLPHADAALLPLGSSRLLELRLGLQPAATAPTPRWRIDLTWQQERAAAGAARPLWRGGMQVGGAAQPAIRQQALGLQAVLHW